MAKAKKEKAPSLAVVRMLCTLIDYKARIRLFTSHFGAGYTSWDYEGGTFPKKEGEHVAVTPSLHGNTAKAGEAAGYIAVSARSGRGSLYYVITDAGKEFAEKHRHLLAEPETVRYIVVKYKPRSWGVQNFVGPLCKVVKETDKRVYVTMVRWGGKTKDYDWCEEVHGRAPNQYVDVEDILYRDVTEAQYRKLFQAGAEYTAWKKGVETDEKDEIEALLAPIRKRYADRRDQKLAQFEDEVREIMEKKGE